ncbi:MAG: alpha/beta fold hydrolase [Proteobacteria bacterium]|nr:alpha/beta fold hydrolase [Pseudomonadota bacterium]MBU1714114.1 alpha/beta fold hydrolase [Pseudomonadota bacterium]
MKLAGYPFKTHKFKINGHAMSYLDEGRGKVIVMLHGNPTWSYFYRNLVPVLRKKYRVIVPDHMGCGLSDKPYRYPYTLRTHIDNLDQLLAHLKVDKCTLVVHDWGGAIGMGYAERHAGQIESLVIMNTAAFRSKEIPRRIEVCRIPLLGEFLVRGLNVFARGALWMAAVKRLPRPVRKGFLAPYNSWRNRIAVYNFVKDIPLSCAHPSWETLLKVEGGLSEFKKTPLLILWGGKDFCFNDYYFNEWKERFPQARSIYFESAGHYLLEDSLKEIVPLLSSFLAEHLSQS